MAIVQPKDLPDDALLTGTERVPLQEAAGGPGSVKDCSINQIKDFSISGLSGSVAALAGDVAALQAGQSGLSGAVAALEAAPPAHSTRHEPGGDDEVLEIPPHAATHIGGVPQAQEYAWRNTNPPDGSQTLIGPAGLAWDKLAWELSAPGVNFGPLRVRLRTTDGGVGTVLIANIREGLDGPLKAASPPVTIMSETFENVTFVFPNTFSASPVTMEIVYQSGADCFIQETIQPGTPAANKWGHQPSGWTYQPGGNHVPAVAYLLKAAAASNDQIPGQDLPVDHTPVNYTPSNSSLSGHLGGIDVALATPLAAYEILIDPDLAIDVVGRKYAALTDALDWWQTSGPVGVATIIRVPGVVDGTDQVYNFTGDHTGKALVIQGQIRELSAGVIVTKLAHILTIALGVTNTLVLVKDAQVKQVQVADPSSRIDLDSVDLTGASAIGFSNVKNSQAGTLNCGVTGESGQCEIQQSNVFEINLGSQPGTTVYLAHVLGAVPGTPVSINQPDLTNGMAIVGPGCHVDFVNGLAAATLRARQDVDGTAQKPNVLDWTGSASTLSGIATVFPNVSGVSGSPALFASFLDLQATPENAASTFSGQVTANIKAGYTVGKVEIFSARSDGTAWAPNGTKIRLRIKGIPA